MRTDCHRPIVTELRLSAFKAHRGATFALGPLTLLTGPSGTGKSSVLEALAALGRLAGGDELGEVFAGAAGTVRGGAAACVPQGAQPDAEVYSVQERARESRQVAAAGGDRAGAVGLAGRGTGAGVGCQDQLEPRGIADHAFGAGDADFAFFQDGAERVEALAAEFACLV